MKMTFLDSDLDDWDDYFVNYTDKDNNTDTISEAPCELQDRMQFKATFIPVLYSLVFVVGVLGNGALVGVLFRSRRTWSVTDTFILHLCVADVLLLFTLPFWASEAVSGWTFGTPCAR
ncbi:hypothetical protein WMY93_026485 [Mugilogobius chulae]|uniref:G-protein coupled receptors family 1 profile domain-containing protein n=1 Tax=Mugilogobius chulae TaxID=88201 RepID=A0AAW0N120_9GOBI